MKVKIGNRVRIIEPCMWAGHCGTVEDLGKIIGLQGKPKELNDTDRTPCTEEDEDTCDCALIELDDSHENIIVRITQCEIIHA